MQDDRSGIGGSAGAIPAGAGAGGNGTESGNATAGGDAGLGGAAGAAGVTSAGCDPAQGGAPTAGTPGVGGNGANANGGNSWNGGGGGAGWFGGGGGGAGSCSNEGTAGAGGGGGAGSSFVLASASAQSISSTTDAASVTIVATIGTPPTFAASPFVTASSGTTSCGSMDVGQAGTITISATGDPVPALSSSGALPAGVSFVDNANGTATISGTPASGSQGTYPITLTATGAAPDAVKQCSLTVSLALAATGASLGGEMLVVLGLFAGAIFLLAFARRRQTS